MKICSRKDLKVITGIMTASLLLGGCSHASSVPVRDDYQAKAAFDLNKVKETGYDKDPMDEEYRRYCVELFSQTVKDMGGDGNVMISPASVMMALDMLAAGAKGESQDQLTNLFAKGQGPLTQQAYAASLMDKINSSKDVKFSCANAVWNNAIVLGDAANKDYVNYIKETFLAEYMITEFDGNTPDEINKWVDKNTDHMIDRVIDSLAPNTAMVLVNAIAFDGKWEEKYDTDHVKDGEFTSADGTNQDAVFLLDTTSAYYETDKATGFIKPYKGGKYAFLAILPSDDSISANEFAAGFTAEDYEEFIDSVTYEYEVHSRLPQFESDFDCLMNDSLKNLGVTDVFDPSKADLSGIGGAPGLFFVSRVIHKTHIEVDSDGTRAAAATVVTVRYKGDIVPEGAFKIVDCDRPFVYAIVDTETMAPVFIGTVNAV